MNKPLSAPAYHVAVTTLLIGQLVWAGTAAAAHQACADCHTRGKALKMGSVNELCLSCHPDNTMDHKLGVVPTVQPAGLPLDSTGGMTCITCHEPHGKDAFESLLRKEKTNLCLSCHTAGMP